MGRSEIECDNIMKDPEKIIYKCLTDSIVLNLSTVNHRWGLSVLHYHEIIVIYPYPFLVVITLLFSFIIFVNYVICILTGSLG